MKESKLKPCPFCGGKAELVKDKTTFTFADSYFVRCDNRECGVQPTTWHRLSEQEARDFWNRRSTNERAN